MTAIARLDKMLRQIKLAILNFLKRSHRHQLGHLIMPSLFMITILFTLTRTHRSVSDNSPVDGIQMQDQPGQEALWPPPPSKDRSKGKYVAKHKVETKASVISSTVTSGLSGLHWNSNNVSDKSIAIWTHLRARKGIDPLPQSMVLQSFWRSKPESNSNKVQVMVLVLTVGITKEARSKNGQLARFLDTPLNSIEMEYESQSVTCPIIPPPEIPMMSYTGTRDLKLFACDIDTELASGAEIVVKISVPDQGMVLRETVRDWDWFQYGHHQPKREYTYTLATLMKPSYVQCAKFLDSFGNKTDIIVCSTPVSERVAEWIAYHLILGFEHIYLYCTESWTGMYEVLQPFIENDQVSVIALPQVAEPVSLEGAQVLMYTTHLQRYRQFTKYQLFSDIDEFLLIGPKLPEAPSKNPEQSLLSRLVEISEQSQAQNGSQLCSLYFAWWIVLPEAPMNMTHKSVIQSFRKAYTKGYPDKDHFGEGKTMTKVEVAGDYANQHFVSFRNDTICQRTVPVRTHAIMVHFRIVPRRTKQLALSGPFDLLDPLYSKAETMLKRLQIW